MQETCYQKILDLSVFYFLQNYLLNVTGSRISDYKLKVLTVIGFLLLLHYRIEVTLSYLNSFNKGVYYRESTTNKKKERIQVNQ